ncbi:MAG: hypothetical protein ACR2F6_03970 [Mycobacteriales bacterium]
MSVLDGEPIPAICRQFKEILSGLIAVGIRQVRRGLSATLVDAAQLRMLRQSQGRLPRRPAGLCGGGPWPGLPVSAGAAAGDRPPSAR